MRHRLAILATAALLAAPLDAHAQTAWDTPSPQGFDLPPRTGVSTELGFWGFNQNGPLFSMRGVLRAGLVFDSTWELGIDAGFAYSILQNVPDTIFADIDGDHGTAANPLFTLHGILGERDWRLRVGAGASAPAVPSSTAAQLTALMATLTNGYNELWLFGGRRVSVIADAELEWMPVNHLYLGFTLAGGAVISTTQETQADAVFDASAAIGARLDNILLGARFRQTVVPTFPADLVAQSAVEVFARPTTRFDNSSIEMFGEFRAVLNLGQPYGVGSQIPFYGLHAAIGLSTTPRAIPDGRYGITDVEFEGVEELDSHSLAACLGTRERSQIAIDISIRGTPECGEPPFDGDHLELELVSYPWTTWPLFDENVFERDLERIERWYRARGFYDARVIATSVIPDSATFVEPDVDSCGDGEGNCEAQVTFSVEEGEPVRLERISIRGIDDLPDGMRQQLRDTLAFHGGEPFDEAYFEQTKQRMLRVLADESYAQARVSGEVKINRQRREAYVVFFIDAGLPNVIGRLCVYGHEELPPELMLGVTYLDAGDTFSLEELEEAQRALYALGVFSAVEVAPVPRAEERDDFDESEDSDGDGVPDQAFCTEPPQTVPDGHAPVDILVHVSPGRRYRIGVGGGFQAGQAVTLGTTTGFGTQQNAAQWDLHLSFFAEDRNFADRLMQARFELRPRVIFQMPFLNFQPAEPTPFGILANGTLRAPGVFEPRTNFVAETRADLGPMPFTNFFRFEPDARFGLDHTWIDGRIYLGGFIHGNAFIPTDRQPIDPRDQLPLTYAIYPEVVARLDLRDNPRNPTAGAFFSANVQGTPEPLSTWSFLRWQADARGYVPLGDRIVLAARFQMAGMHVLSYDEGQLDSQNRYQLHQLGPPALHLTGGGASNNRGFLPGLMGDSVQRLVGERRSEAEVRRGVPPRQRVVRITGGTAMWQASFEVRVRLTVSLGLVAFADAGDVIRPENVDDAAFVGFRFDRPQLSFGLGLRYRTIVGPLRVDFALRPDDLQQFGDRSLPPDCRADRGQECRPRNTLFGIPELPGAVHLTIGESF